MQGTIQALRQRFGDQTMLEIGLLGPPYIRLDGRLITSFESRTAEAVLHYLAATGGTHSRETLAEFFWPERSQAQSQSNLRTVLHRLRRVLGSSLEITRDHVSLAADNPLWVDLHALNESLRSADLRHLSPEAEETVADALALYRGPFLDGFNLTDCPAFERWMSQQREAWQVQVIAWLEGLVQSQLKHRLYLPAITQTIRLIEMDPLRETSTGLMMRLLAAVGQPVQALETYARLETLLEDELGIPPSSALRDLRAQIESGQVTREVAYPVVLAAQSDAIVNPYRGLLAFEESNAGQFYGRQALVDEVLARYRVDPPRLLALVGASGVGKSSFVRAGIAPAMKRTGDVVVALMVPGSDPMANLSACLALDMVTNRNVLAQLDATLRRSGRRLILIVDQLEELFTLVDDANQREEFLGRLTAIALSTIPVHVIVTLRADFYDRPLEYPEFGRLMAQATLPVLPLTPPELEQAIVVPAIQAGIAFEEGLVPQIIAEVSAQPGALPLMQVTLVALTEMRQGRMLTWQAYRDLGGVAGALSQQAEVAFGRLSAPEQEAVQQLFLRLVVAGEFQSDTRRRLPEAELLGAFQRAYYEHMVEVFTRNRLLIRDYNPALGGATIEIAHEALIRAWGRFQEWLDSDRMKLLHYRQLGVMAGHWVEAGYNPDYLATGARLAQFEALLASRLLLTDAERQFVQASRDDRDRRIAAECMRRDYETALRLAVEANETLNRGATGEVPALLALHSLGLTYTPSGDAALLNALQRPLLGQRYSGHSFRTRSIAPSPDGRYLVTGGADLTVHLWDAGTGEDLRVLEGLDAPVTSVAFAPDSCRFATGFSGNAASVWSVDANVAVVILDGHPAPVVCVAWSQDGLRLATGCADGSLHVWQVETGTRIWSQTGHIEAVHQMAFVEDDGLLSVSAGSACLHDAASGACTWRYQDMERRLTAVALKSSIEVLVGAEDGSVVLCDRTHQGVHVLSNRQRSPVVALWADKNDIISVHRNSTVQAWADPFESPIWQQQYPDEVFSAARAPDHRVIYLGGSLNADFRAYVWRPPTQSEPRLLTGHTNGVTGVAYTPDGRFLLSTSLDNTARLWEMETGRTIRVLPHPEGQALKGVAASPDGRFALTTCDDAFVRLWDIASGDLLHTFHGHTDAVSGVAFSPDGAWALTGSHDGTMRLWDLRTGRELRCFAGHQGPTFRVCFSPDGRHVFSPSADRTGRLWDVETGELIRVFSGHSDWMTGASFAPDGSTIATTSVDRAVRLWNVETGALLRVFTGHTAFVRSVTFAPDGGTIATGSEDRSMRLWDVETGRQLRIFVGHESGVWHMCFSPDGRYLASPSTDHTIRIWRVDIDDVKAFAREVLPRGFTEAERAQYGVD